MREIVHLQAGQCGNQIGAKVSNGFYKLNLLSFVNQTNNQYSFTHIYAYRLRPLCHKERIYYKDSII